MQVLILPNLILFPYHPHHHILLILNKFYYLINKYIRIFTFNIKITTNIKYSLNKFYVNMF